MQPLRRDSKPIDLSRMSYVTPFKLILFTLLALFFAAILLTRRARVPLALAVMALFWLFAAGWWSVALISAAIICGISGSLFSFVYERRSRQKETPSEQPNNTA